MQAPSGERRNTPGGPIFSTLRPGAFGRRQRCSPLEVSGPTAWRAPIRRAEIASVKSVNI
jgi:hypothetical protein